MPSLLCPVRGCGRPLSRGERAWACPQGHSFDVARSGYCNLLQPQDRKSKRPGDPREAVLARRRFLDAGHGELLLAELRETVAGLPLPAPPAVLDLGCGEGYFLGSLAAGRPMEAHGIDLSTDAIDLAARRWPGVCWLVVNADRLLPYPAESFDLVLSLTARRNPSEVRRVLRPTGRLVVAVPGEDDLIELRELVLGEGVKRDRDARVREDFAPFLKLESRRTVRRRERLSAEAAGDALAATYRGARHRERLRLASLAEMDVTLSYDLFVFQP
jgi:23S rRNA (guanine745-N1)-methyltransferase